MKEREKCNIIDFKTVKPTIKKFNNLFIKDEILFEEPSLDFFSFNSPFGACKKCEGFGKVTGIDSELVIPNPNLSVYEDAIVCWKGEKMSVWKAELINNAHNFDFPVHEPIRNLSNENLDLLWNGNQLLSRYSMRFLIFWKKCIQNTVQSNAFKVSRENHL